MIRILQGDCRGVLGTQGSDSFDSCVTDPPYHLTTGKKGGSGEASVNLESPYGRARIGTGFMGMKWDGGDIAQSVEMWAEVFRVLKPGAHLLAFGGTRTYHRMVCAIEDAGFEIRDQIGWLYGSGFPKSLDVSKAIDKAAGAERVKVGEYTRGAAMHPGNEGADNWRENYTGRVDVTAPATDAARQWQGWGTALKPAWEPIVVARKPLIGTVAANVLAHGTGALNIDGCRVKVTDASYARNASGDRGHDENRKREMDFGMTAGKASEIGRWPANIIHDGSDEVIAAFPQASGAVAPVRGTEPSAKTQNVLGEFGGRAPSDRRDGGGSAARFFYCAKSSKRDRGEGNTHPTVKPTKLMRYLCRLVTPPGGTVLDPFMGSGSTGRGAVLEGFSFVGIERDESYVAIARARIRAAASLGLV